MTFCHSPALDAAAAHGAAPIYVQIPGGGRLESGGATRKRFLPISEI